MRSKCCRPRPEVLITSKNLGQRNRKVTANNGSEMERRPRGGPARDHAEEDAAGESPRQRPRGRSQDASHQGGAREPAARRRVDLGCHRRAEGDGIDGPGPLPRRSRFGFGAPQPPALAGAPRAGRVDPKDGSEKINCTSESQELPAVAA